MASPQLTSEAELPETPSGIQEFFSRWKFHFGAATIVCGAFAVFGVWSFQAWSLTPASTFISLRYAEHIRHGAGLVWNIGEIPPIEGYVNPLWIALNALARPESFEPLATAKIASLVISILSALVAFLWTYRSVWQKGLSGLRCLAASSALAVYLLSPAVAIAAVAGSESALSVLCFTVFFFYSERYASAPKWSFAIALAVLSVSAILLRNSHVRLASRDS
jgi:hypothetical protein